LFVKICGITTEEDALVSVAMGADALGFNFVPGSVRQLSPTAARDIVRRLPAGVLAVGIFRNELPQRVVDIVNEVGLGRPSFMDASPRRTPGSSLSGSRP